MSIEPAETPESLRTGHRSWDFLASFAAITISAASLYTAYHTSHSMERLVHASSWPALQLDSSNETAEGAATLSFDIHNTGVGPAQIHDFKILVDGQPVSSQGWLIDNLATACCNEARAEALAAAGGNRQAMLGPDATNRISSRSLAPNEWISAIRWPKTDSNAVLWRQVDLARQSGRIKCALVIVRFSTSAGRRIRTSSLNSQCEVAADACTYRTEGRTNATHAVTQIPRWSLR